MSSWQIYTSTTESLMNETTNYKNGLLSQETFNQKMLLNLSYLIYVLNKEKVSQMETNPTLDFFLPVSQLSYTMESQLNNKTIEPVSNEVEKEEMFRLSSTAKDDIGYEVQFEESPIIPQSNHNDSTKTDSFEEVLDIDDDSWNCTNYIRLSGKFDLYSDDFNLSDKKIEYSFYSDEMKFSFGRNCPRDSPQINGSSLSPLISIRKTRYSSWNLKVPKRSIKIKESDYEEEFKGFLSKKAVRNFINDMNANYIRYMLIHYTRIKSLAEKAFFCEDKMFLNLVKEFLLAIGVVDNKLYEDTLRNIIYQKGACDFESFILSFNKILKLQEEYSIIKYKFLLYIVRMNNEVEISKNHLLKYFDLLRCKKVYDEDLCENIFENLIARYLINYPSIKGFNFKNLIMTLETFFENK